MQDTSPIDIVYLWVDGNDSHWRLKRQRAADQLGQLGHRTMARFGNVEGRFRDNDELRYSLRALDQFFPAHGHVYLVTDAQVPVWLQDSDRLTIVDHRALIPHDALPTFDSGHIESYIHRIPGLSERYFYFNDDVFFGAPVHTSDWFYPGGFYVTWSDDACVPGLAMQSHDTSLENASRLSHQWLQAKAHQQASSTPHATHRMQAGYAHTPRTFAHSPRPMLKSLLYALEHEAHDLFAQVRSTVFRTWDKPTLVSDFVLRWALAHGVAQLRNYSHSHVSTGDLDTHVQLKQLRHAWGSLDFFCINDTTDDAHPDDPRLAQVRDTLQALLQMPSAFEKVRHTHSRHPSHGARQQSLQTA